VVNCKFNISVMLHLDVNYMKKGKVYAAAVIAGIIAAVYLVYPFQDSQGQELLGISSPENISIIESDRDDYADLYRFPDPDETLYQMGLYLDVSNNQLHGTTVIDTSNTTSRALDELWFTVYPNAFQESGQTPVPPESYYKGFDPGYLEIENIKVNGQQVEYYMDGVSMQVLLPFDILPGRDILVEMTWIARIPEAAYRFGSKDGVFMLGNFYPVLDVFDEEGWHLAYNSAFGDPFCFHCADYLVRVNIPESYDLVSTGMNIDHFAEDNGRETYIIDARKVRDFCLLVMYDYEEIETEINNTTIKCYTPAGDKVETISEITDRCGEIIQYYSCRWGSYPYQEFKVAFVPMYGFHGMEHSGLIFLSEELFSPCFTDYQSNFVLAHEIAHQWWYGMVGNDQLAEAWLDEGLANWSADEYLRECRNMTAPWKRTAKITNLNSQLNEIYSTDEYYQTIYNGGEEFWIALEEELGRETIDNVLRRYLADYKFDIAATRDLLEVIKKEAHKDMDCFFNRWFKSEDN